MKVTPGELGMLHILRFDLQHKVFFYFSDVLLWDDFLSIGVYSLYGFVFHHN